MFESVFPVFIFFITISAFTITGFPIVFLLFRNFADKGYAFTKLVSLLITGYIVWLGASIELFHFSSVNSWLFFLWFALISAILYLRYWKAIKKFVYEQWRILLLEELLFWGFFTLFLLIRFGNPDLWHPYRGGEKPMDFAFLNGILRSQTFPPLDPWFSQGTINYYYYGQYLMALLIKITGIIPSVFYNIAVPFLFAQSAIAVFSIVVSYTKSYFFGLLGSIFLVLIGNLAQIQVIIKAISSPVDISSEWYWNATRVMPNSEINEFPFFTFLYADLHSHMISLPIVTLLIAVLFSFLQSKNISNIAYLTKTTFAAFLLGIIYATNLWDYPSFALLSFFLIAIALGLKEKVKIVLFIKILFTPAILFSVSNLLFLPFITHFQKGALGLGTYNGPLTQVSDYLLIHGFFLFIFLSYILFNFKPFFLTDFKKIIPLFISGLISLLFVYLHLPFFAIVLAIVNLGFLALFYLKKNEHNTAELFSIALFIFAILLTLLPDLLDFKLGLGRMNTVFKFYFQAWILFAISSAFLLFYIFKKAKTMPKILYYSWIGVFVLFFIASFSFIPTATYAKIKDRMSPIAPITLDGKEFMKTSFYFDEGRQLNLNSDYQATEWINTNIKGSPVILEGVAPFYRWGARVSVYTGLPSIIGWEWHEIAHRSYLPPGEIANRIADVKLAYETQSLPEFLEIIRKYNVQYIYLGDLEKAYYENNGFDKFKQGVGAQFEIVYQNPHVTIYKIKN